MVKVLFYRLTNEARIPEKAKEGDACYDVYSVRDDTLNPGETKLFPLGFKISFPEGYEIVIRPRSGLALKDNITILNSPGTIDWGYRGEVGIILHNAGSKFIWVPVGTKIAQMTIKKVQVIEFEEVEKEEMLGDTTRGEDGFGSTNGD